MNYKNIIYQKEQIASIQSKAYPYIIHTAVYQNSTKLVLITGLYKHLNNQETKYFKNLFLNKKYTETEFKTTICKQLKGYSYSFYRVGNYITRVEVLKKRIYNDDEADKIINNLIHGIPIKSPQFPKIIKEKQQPIIKKTDPSSKTTETPEDEEDSGPDFFETLVKKDAIKNVLHR